MNNVTTQPLAWREAGLFRKLKNCDPKIGEWAFWILLHLFCILNSTIYTANNMQSIPHFLSHPLPLQCLLCCQAQTVKSNATRHGICQEVYTGKVFKDQILPNSA